MITLSNKLNIYSNMNQNQIQINKQFNALIINTTYTKYLK